MHGTYYQGVPVPQVEISLAALQLLMRKEGIGWNMAEFDNFLRPYGINMV